MNEEPQHWPTERMIAEGHADYATPEDLADLDDDLLKDVAEICDVDQFAPDECIPCLAHTMFLDRRAAERERLESMAPGLPTFTEEQAASLDEVEDIPVFETPKLDRLMREADTFTQPEMKPVAEQFADKVEELNALVSELLSGPPIPPPNVTLTDLALLVVGASRWVRMTEAQGVELSPEQQAVLDSTKALVARLQS